MKRPLIDWREDSEAIRVMGFWRFAYSRLFYRAHMRLIHRFNGHQLRERPIDHAKHCAWCGHLVSRDGTVLIDGPAMNTRIDKLTAEAMRTGKLATPDT